MAEDGLAGPVTGSGLNKNDENNYGCFILRIRSLTPKQSKTISLHGNNELTYVCKILTA